MTEWEYKIVSVGGGGLFGGGGGTTEAELNELGRTAGNSRLH